MLDYHIHSKYSHDGQNTIDEVCKVAIEKGVKEIAFTEHYDAENSLYSDCKFNYNAYFADIHEANMRYEGKLKVRAAVELGDVMMHRNVASEYIKSSYFDFVLLAVHYIAFDNLWFLEYDRLKIKEGVVQYYTNLKDSVMCFHDYDCVAHLDLPKRYFIRENISVNMLDYQEYVRDILKIMIENGKGLEVNSSTLRSGLYDEPMPSISILKAYKELGGEIITIGSDAHRVEDVGLGIKKCNKLLKECGFLYVTTYQNRMSEFHKID